MSYRKAVVLKMLFQEQDFKQFDHFNIKQLGKGIVHVEINKPKMANSMSEVTWTQYGSIIKKLETTDDIRAVILSGYGKHFSAGIDLSASANFFQQMNKEKDPSKSLKYIQEFQESIKAGVNSKIPVIAVIHGVCYGLALDLISASSIRVGTTNSKLCIKEIDIGIMADIGSLQRLPFLVNNISKLNELALTAQEFSGKDAKALGLVSEVFDQKEDAFKYALRLARSISVKYPPAVHGTKKHLDFMTINSPNVAQGMDQVKVDNVELMKDPDFARFFINSEKKRKSKM